MSDRKLSRICFTVNNYKLADVKQILSLDYKYVILGYEEAPTTKTRHIQGFINFTSRHRFGWIKNSLPHGTHLEPARGSDDENRKYCSKGGEFMEEGEPQGQGKRNDIGIACQAIASGANLKRIAEEFPAQYVRYYRGFKALKDQIAPTPPRDFKTNVVVFVGPPGAGKSRTAAERAGTDVYYKPRGEWWDGYCQQRSVIVDDYYGWLKYDELLKVCDRYPHQVPIKGGFEQFRSEIIYITSNIHIDKWYKFDGFSPDAIARRITEYYQWTLSNENIWTMETQNTFQINY